MFFVRMSACEVESNAAAGRRSSSCSTSWMPAWPRMAVKRSRTLSHHVIGVDVRSTILYPAVSKYTMSSQTCQKFSKVSALLYLLSMQSHYIEDV